MNTGSFVVLLTTMILGVSTTSAYAQENFEIEIREALNSYHAALSAGNLEQILDHFSNQYSNSLGATKTMLPAFFGDPGVQAAMAAQQPNLDNTVFNLVGDVAVVTPIIYTSPVAPRATWTYRFRKEEDGVWRLINSEQIN